MTKITRGVGLLPFLCAWILFPVMTPAVESEKPSAQVALALVTTVKGTTQTLETALSEVLSNTTDKVLEAFVPGFEPPSFITHKTNKITAAELGTGTPTITYTVTVGPTTPPGTHTYSVEYSFFAQPIEFFVAAEAIQVSIFVQEFPLAVNLDSLNFGSVTGGERKSVEVRNLIERPLRMTITPPAGTAVDEEDATFELENGSNHVIDLTVQGAVSIDDVLEIQVVDLLDPPEVSLVQTVTVTSVGSDGGGGAMTLTADFDGSGRVDFADFLLFAGAFGGTESRFDLTGDGRVDFSDFLEFATQFGKAAS